MLKSIALLITQKCRETNYWLPMVDEKFIVWTLDEDVIKDKLKDVEIADAQMAKRSVFLDTK